MPTYNLKYIRRHKFMTQEELSAKSGVSRPTIIKLESGNPASVSSKTLLKLADALGVDVRDLFICADCSENQTKED